MKRLTTLALIAACSFAAKPLLAQQPTSAPAKRPVRAHTYKREVPDSLLSQVKITEDSARTVALHQVRGGRIQGLELENEHGTLVYSWDIKVPGKAGITEVQVSAIDGKVVATEHENH